MSVLGHHRCYDIKQWCKDNSDSAFRIIDRTSWRLRSLVYDHTIASLEPSLIDSLCWKSRYVLEVEDRER